MRDKASLADCYENLKGVSDAVPSLLSLFSTYEIHATWATVGFLFFETRLDLLQHLPTIQPQYEDIQLSPYHYLNREDANLDKQCHFAPGLIRLIADAPGQEVGSHTFSHYYCLEKGQTPVAFSNDLRAAIRIAQSWGIELKSLVFPRNQFSVEYVELCRRHGFLAYRGNEPSWLYSGRSREKETSLRRLLRLVDAYVDLTGHNTYDVRFLKRHFPYDIPSSRFLRPYSNRLRRLEPLRLRRILNGLTYAAKNGRIYHLWWHPHNFGRNLAENTQFLKRVFDHFCGLRDNSGMQSLTMTELSRRLASS
jgi:peptidoglycan/xylan/chitin deacetylase (PgdA/CDA1 family)